MPYLYQPPQRRNPVVLDNAARTLWAFPVSSTTYKVGGSWFNQETVDNDTILASTYVFRTPTVVSDVVAAELTVFGVGTLTPV